MPKSLRPHYNEILQKYKLEYERGKLTNAWIQLERAHIVGQKYPIEHTQVHWKMLLYGIRIKSFKEIIGQLPRLVVGGVKSFVGRVPVGNPGGADVPPLKVFPIEKDIRDIFESAGLRCSE